MLQGQVISLGIRLGRGFGQGITLDGAFPATQGPKTGGPAKEVGQTQAPTQACEAAVQVRSGCTATTQGCLLTGQVKTASAQV